MAETEHGNGTPLEESIEAARTVLSEYDKYLGTNETATRTVVIDPVLTALGWDVRKPERVRLEHRANGNKLDYVLLSTNGGILAVVEAKPAGSGLDKDRKQASGYAAEVGARYAVVTNGGRWEAWEMVSQKPRQQTVLVEVNLTTGEVAEIALTLAPLHRDVLGI